MNNQKNRKSMPVTISNLDCFWDPIEKKIVVKGNLPGFIPTSELGIDHIESRSSRVDENTGNNIPVYVLTLLQKPFKALILHKKNGKYVFSIKAYLEYAKEQLVCGNIYTAVVYNVCRWGIFCTVGDAPVLVHITKWSKCFFSNPRLLIYPGQKLKVKILSKRKDLDGIILVEASRKDVSSNKEFHLGEKVSVILGHSTFANDGFFCEIEPDIAGIVDVYPEDYHYLSEGMRVVAYIRKKKDKGYVLRFSHILIE